MNNSILADDLHRALVEVNSDEARSKFGQLNARAVFEARNVPAHEWPRFDPNLKQDAYRKAQEYLYMGMKSVLDQDQTEDSDDYKKILERAGELLEKIYDTSQYEPAEERSLGLFQAAIAYYLSGHYARAYVIMKGLEELPYPPYPWDLLKQFFLKDLMALRDKTLEVLLRPETGDELLADTLLKGEIRDVDAVNWILEATLGRSLSLVKEHIETGHVKALERAGRLLDSGVQLSVQRRWFEWWTLMHSARAILEEYKQNSLWTVLDPLLDDDSSGISRRYCLAASRRQPPISELWRTQVQAFPHINEPSRQSYCIKMPTSSGKTQIAELTILRFLADTATDQTKKCIYVAPFRALATELEQSFKASLGTIGVGITELYGGFDLTPVDLELFEKSRVIIATPEKADAFLRYRPELTKQVGLLVIDEGHIIDTGIRGLRYELFLHRMVRKFADKGVRTLFISAVMPSPEQFTTWVADKDTEQGLITSNWRASRLSLGTLEWANNSARIEYRYQGHQRLAGSMFVPNFVSSLPKQALREAKAGRLVFPRKDSKGEQVALAAIQAAEEGPTLVFVPQKGWANSVAEAILGAISLKDAIERNGGGGEYKLPNSKDDMSQQELADCIAFATEVAGPDSLVTRSLQAGFILHHADIPRALRARLEILARNGIVSLTVATNTLAQGVNLPLRTVLIHSLTQGRDRPVSAVDFWNICGRAGRAMKENEGLVLLCTDSQKAEWAKQQLDNYVQQADMIAVQSSIRAFLERVQSEWSKSYPNVDVAELCTHLAENRIDWMSQDQIELLRVLDSQLLALFEEAGNDNLTPEGVQNLFERSLLFLQLGTATPGSSLTESQAVDMLLSRILHIHRAAPTPAHRRQFYRTGLALSDCVYLQEHREAIVEALTKSKDYLEWKDHTRAEYLVQLCSEHLLQLSDISPQQSPGLKECWSRVLYLWLLGNTAEQIAHDPEVSCDGMDAMKISSLIDDLFDYRFPWGFNSLFSFLETESEAESTSWTIADEVSDTSSVPAISRYFPSLIRHGVHSPIAAIVISLGLRSRSIASAIAEHYSGPVAVPSIQAWLSTLDETTVETWSIDAKSRDNMLRFAQQAVISPTSPNPKGSEIEKLELVINNQEYLAPISIGSSLMLQASEPPHVEVYSSAVEHLGTIKIYDEALYQRIAGVPVSATVYEQPGTIDSENVLLKFSLPEA